MRCKERRSYRYRYLLNLKTEINSARSFDALSFFQRIALITNTVKYHIVQYVGNAVLWILIRSESEHSLKSTVRHNIKMLVI
jgi:hypothetical protein